MGHLGAGVFLVRGFGMERADADCFEHPLSGSGGNTIDLIHAGEAPRMSPVVLVDALAVLRPLVRPVSVEFAVGCVDRTYGLQDASAVVPRPRWLLYERPAALRLLRDDAAVQSGGREPVDEDALLDVLFPMYRDPVLLPVPELSVRVVRAGMDRALAQPVPDPAGYRTAVCELWVESSRVRLPGGVLPGRDRLHLRVSERPQVAAVPLERGAAGTWVTGLSRRVRVHRLVRQAPVTLRVLADHGSLELRLGLNWSLWTEPGSPGHALVVDAVGGLRARGWELTGVGECFAAALPVPP